MDERNWTDRPLPVGDSITGPGCRVTRVDPGRLSLVSGDLAAALDRLAPGADMVGFGGVPGTPAFGLRIGRDSALLVNASAADDLTGWQDGGFALSPAGGGYARFDMCGPAAWQVLAHGLSAAAPFGSPSAAVLFCGMGALVSGLPEGLALWVPFGHVTACSTFLSRVLDAPFA